MASASPSRIVVGPYNITFDLNTPKDYTLEVMPPLEENNYTAYTALINVVNETKAGIYIWDLKAPVDATITTIEKVYKGQTHDIPNASVEIGKIDGKDGIIAYYLDQQYRQVVLGLYWLDSKKIDNGPLATGSIEVRLVSILPRSSTDGMAIAKSLINTLHIEKFSNTSAQHAKKVSPVATPEPYIRVRNQNVEDNHGAALIDEAFSDGPGWVVIYNDPYSKPLMGPIGHTHLNDGLNRIVKVNLNMAQVTAKLYAVLYKDKGQVGTFEQYGPDFPLDPHTQKIYSFNSKWPNPLADLQIDWRGQVSDPSRDWL